jgi:hypothetical protein
LLHVGSGDCYVAHHEVEESDLAIEVRSSWAVAVEDETR